MLQMRSWPLGPWIASVVLALSGLGGCGYSEDAWRAKLREVDDLKQQLQQQEALDHKTQRELADTQATIERLRQKLQEAGVDDAAPGRDVEEQARALEQYRQRAALLEAIEQRFERLRDALRGLGELGVQVTVRHDRLVIQLPGDVLFDAGRETLRREGESMLGQVAAVVRGAPDLGGRSFQVAGHTDGTRYAGAFKDNWGLSVMRAREVLAYLVRAEADHGGGLDPKHWSAAGYGDTDPLVANDGADERQKNRRCELVLLPTVEETLDGRHVRSN
ncbi:MAG: OmpA family protein [Polyangiaceae bacterium]|nr:OmpA family protein [Polyangiaceae bacterium]